MGVSEIVDGSAALSDDEASSVDVNGEAMSVIFDGSTTIVNGELVAASEE